MFGDPEVGIVRGRADIILRTRTDYRFGPTILKTTAYLAEAWASTDCMRIDSNNEHQSLTHIKGLRLDIFAVVATALQLV